MPCENTEKRRFDSLGKRVLYSYIAAYPAYRAVPDIDKASQRQMYDFMARTLRTLYENPAMIGIAEAPDDCYQAWELNNKKPALIKAMEQIETKLIAFIEALIKLGKAGRVEGQSLVLSKADMTVSKQLAQRLNALGVTATGEKTRATLRCADFPDIFPAWTAYARCDDESAQKVTRAMAFMHAKYFGRVYRATEYFANFFPDQTKLAQLEAFFEERGFALSNFDIGNKTRFAYVKWQKEYPDKETASMCASYNWRKEYPLTFEFRVPRFRVLLNGYDDMDADLKRFLYPRLKPCDGCGYCTQTDKTGKRERLARAYTLDGDTQMKCPLFPNFSMTALNDGDIDCIKRLLIMADGTGLSYR